MEKANGFKQMMGDKDLRKSFFSIGFSNVACIYYCLIFAVLGYVYQAFPGQEKLANLMVTIPGILACIGGYFSSALLRKASAKSVMILSYALTIAGGLASFFFGGKSLLVAVISVSLAGFAAGTIPPAKATAWARVATPFMKDKMTWLNLFYTFGWMFLNTFGSVMAARTGHWNMAFASTFFLIPILLIIIFLFPGKNTIQRVRERYDLDAMDAAAIDSNKEAAKDYMPKSVIGLVVITLVVCLFYMALNLNASSYIINELGIGTSVTVALGTNIHMILAVFLNLVLFAIFRKLKGGGSTVGLLCMAAGMLIAAFMPSIAGYLIGFTVTGIGMDIHNGGLYTVCAMAPKGKSVGTANGLINGTIYLGEAICVYIAPLVAGILFHSDLPSAAIKTGGIMCAILAFVILPFYRAAYKDAFAKDDAAAREAKG